MALDELRRRLTDTVAAQLVTLLEIEPAAADITLAPSGSDTELLAVMLAAAAAEERLTNILISPEETGRAVALAGAGCLFDDLAGSGAPVRKGQEAWPGRTIEVRQVAIRAVDGRPRPITEIEAELRDIVTDALGRGHRILLHVLACSKTGLGAPSTNGVAELVAMAADRIDVVVDACQMRTPLSQIADWIGRGWMVQLSGSKFFTGPPFSGALTIPPRYRERATRVRRLLAAAPGVGRPDDWNAWWRPRLMPQTSSGPASFGFLFRWLPAIAEAHLLGALPAQFCSEVFERFRSSLVSRLAHSNFLTSIAPPDASGTGSEGCENAPEHGPTDLSTRSIVCFTVTVRDRLGNRRTLDTQECQRLFELLNFDLSQRLGSLTAAEQITAAQCAHIGQPVSLSLGKDQHELSILRMVIGARFFTIVGYAGSPEGALASEIADALRAIDKLELLAERWGRVQELGMSA